MTDQTKIYPIRTTRTDGHGRDYVYFASQPGRTNMSREERIEGWLGNTNGVSRTALGAFDNLTDARRAARKALGYGPRQGKMRTNYYGEPHEFY